MASQTPNSFFGNEDLIYLTMLTAMYNNNNTQIQNLQRANDTISSSILSIINRNVNNAPVTAFPNNSPPLYSGFANNVTPSYNVETPTTPQTPPLNRNLFRRNLSTPRAPINNRRRPLQQNDLLLYLDNFFTPISIYPTQTQIEAATRNVRFSDIVRPMNASCPISLETFVDNSLVTMIRHCGHVFNRDMLTAWFQSHCICPVCRYDIRDYVPNNTVSHDEQQNVRTILQTQNDNEERNSNSTNETTETPEVSTSDFYARIQPWTY
jgi:hypothetical protein